MIRGGNLKNIIPKLESISQENSNMGTLAKYLLNYDQDIADLKISKICDELYISIASATRLAKRLGLDGFSQLKIYLAEEKTQNKISNQKYNNISTSKYYNDVMESLNETLNDLNMSQLETVSEKITKSKMINFFAVGGSHVVITDFAQKLSRIKIPVTFYGDSHLQYVEAMNSDKDTICLGLTYSGLTHEIIANLQVAKQNGATTVIVTNNKNLSYDFIDYIVDISSVDNSMRTYSISSRFSALAVFDLMYLNIIDSNADYYNAILENNRYIKNLF